MATTIHVGNLSFDTNEEDLKKFFSKYGKVTDSYIVRRGGRPRGYGFIEFDSSVSADNALAANGNTLDGRNINIEKARGKIVKSNFSSPRDDGDRNERSGGGGYGGGYGGGRRYGGGYGGGNRYGGGGYGGDDGDDEGGYDGDRNERSGGGGYGGGMRRYGGGGNRYGGGGYGGGGYDEGYDGGNRYGGGGPNRYGSRSFRGGRGPMRRNFYNLRPSNDGRNSGRRTYQRRNDEDKEKSTSTVYVSNLPFSIDDAQLAKLFNKYKVKTTHVVQSISGRSRGYGFVEFETEEDQQNAIKEMENFEVKGSDDRTRNITVKVALVEKPTSLNNKDTDKEESDD
jgi:RNA recognition motif-containing protein